MTPDSREQSKKSNAELLNSQIMKLFRSVLFTPANRTKSFEKVLKLSADTVVFDLEDSVPNDGKSTARDNIVNFLSNARLPAYLGIIVRVNCPHSTEWGKDDLLAVSDLHLDAILLPKVESAEAIITSKNILSSSSNNISFWAMIETCKGVQHANSIAQCKDVSALVFGSNDLTKDLKGKHTLNREPLLYSMSQTIIAARAEGKLVIDGVHVDILDENGLMHSCVQGSALGFDGKSLIHPSQIGTANTCFAPSVEDTGYASRVKAGYEEAEREGKAVCVVDNKMIEFLHYKQALDVLAIAASVEERQSRRST